jgi:hydroxyethylthiazole kinase
MQPRRAAALEQIAMTPQNPAPVALAAEAARRLAALRAQRPLVQAITNYVSMDVAANALLAIGASPAMIHAPEEAEDFGAIANALVVNIGTLSTDWVVGMEAAAQVAGRNGRPWALDPVGVGATRFRDETTRRLLSLRPTIVRGNASEIIACARIVGLHDEAAAPKGVDSAHGTEAARASAIALARRQNCVVAATGAVDFVTDGERSVEIANGSPLMAKVTALGCALSAIVAAFAAGAPDAFMATVAAVGVYGVAGEKAAEVALRPGSFRVAFIDALDAVSAADVATRMRAR